MASFKTSLRISLILFLIPNFAFTQDKFEKETRIKPQLVDSKVIAYVDSIHPKLKIKWYREESHQGTSIEAKFKHSGKKYSLEFDTLGNVQDAEFIIDKSEINTASYSKIEHILDSLYSKWKIIKIQRQYEGHRTEILSSIINEKVNRKVEISYEIVLVAKGLEDSKLYEFSFSELGDFIQKQQIVLYKIDHLEY